MRLVGRLDSKKLTTKIATIVIFVVNFLPNGLFVAIFVLGKICCYFFSMLHFVAIFVYHKSWLELSKWIPKEYEAYLT